MTQGQMRQAVPAPWRRHVPQLSCRSGVWQRFATKWANRSLTSASTSPCEAQSHPLAKGQAERITLSPTRLMPGAGTAIGRQTRSQFACGAAGPRGWKAAGKAEKAARANDLRGSVACRHVSRWGRLSAEKAKLVGEEM